MKKKGDIFITTISIFVVLCASLFFADSIDNQISLLRYCKEIGYDGYTDKSNYLEAPDYYCVKETTEGNIIKNKEYVDIKDTIDEGCWFFCELGKIND